MTRKLCLCFLVVLLFLLPSLSYTENSKYTNPKVDLSMRHWGQYYFPLDDWKHWKAQGLAESKLDMAAKSNVGAIGIMQLMPMTAKSLKVNPYSMDDNIKGGICYDKEVMKYWLMITDRNEQRRFIYGSYNAGPGWILKAYRLTHSISWETVSNDLPKITGKNAKQTQAYVKHIERFYNQIQ